MRRPWVSWLFVGTLFVLCGALGVLQYEWIGKVSEASREQLRESLRANLVRLSQDFNAEIFSAARSLVPSAADAKTAADELERRYQRSTHTNLFQRIGLAIPGDGQLKLQLVDPHGGELQAA